MKVNRTILYQSGIVIVAALLFIPFLGDVHLFDWDEINFAESAREMILSKNYLTVQINFMPFWEKPPLFIWMQVLSMKIFGINEFAARFPDAMCGVLSLLLIFNIGRKFQDENFGLIWVLVYVGSLLPFFYFKSGIIDPWFNFFIFLSIYLFILAVNLASKKNLYIILSAASLGLAVMTKGPVAILIFAITVGVYWIIQKFRLHVSFLQLVIFAVVLIIVGGFWFILQILNGHFNVVMEFIQYQIRLFQTKDAGHGGFLFYHFVVLLIGVFPASVFAIQGFKKSKTDNPLQNDVRLWMTILFWTVLILFTIVKTKIVHYSSLCYLPMTYLAARSLYKMIQGEFRFRLWQTILLSILALLLGTIGILFPLLDHYKQWLIDQGFITHSFTIGNLQAQVHWRGYEWITGIILLAGATWAIVVFYRKNIRKGIILLFGSSLIFVYLTIVLLTPRIEGYVQKSAISFFKNTSDKDAYVYSFYKSYALYFYGKKQMNENKKAEDITWLTKGDIDKPVYFIMRLDKLPEIKARYPQIKILEDDNGYVIGVRYPDNKKTN